MTALADKLTTIYSSLQVCHAARLTYRQLDYAVRTGLVQCARERAGSGDSSVHGRRFRPVDIHVAAVMGRLSDLGAQHQVRRAVAYRLYLLPRPWEAAHLVAKPDAHCPSVRIVAKADPLRAFLFDSQWVLRLPPTLEPLP